MFNSKVAKATLIAALISVSGASNALPNGGGIYDVYAGSAWFTGNNGGVVVTAGTHSSCMTKLADAISYRVTNWGWSVQSNQGCKKTKYKSFHQLSMVALEEEYQIPVYEQKLEAIKLNHQVQMDAEIEALEAEYRIEEFKARVEEEAQPAK
ncbi:MAG: hypothetical protein ACI8WB_002610 [Phenylobacterium sp.]|jgi:hypothetical protein